MGLRVLHGFDVSVNLCGHHARLARNVAANHQHHTKLAHRVRKREHRGREQTGLGHGQRHREEGIDWVGPQRGGHFHGPLAHGFKRKLNGLHRKGQREHDGADQQPREGEGQHTQAQRLRDLAHPALWAQQHQEVEAQHRGRQHQRQRHQRIDPGAPARPGLRQPPGQRGGQHQQQCRGECSQLQRQRNGLQGLWGQRRVHRVRGGGSTP